MCSSDLLRRLQAAEKPQTLGFTGWAPGLRLLSRKGKIISVRSVESGHFRQQKMEARGLEPLTFRVWGERSSRLSYASMSSIVPRFPKKARGILFFLQIFWVKNGSKNFLKKIQNTYWLFGRDGLRYDLFAGMQNTRMQEWRNWQTRTVQVRVVAIPWEFKSLFLHYNERYLIDVKYLSKSIQVTWEWV